MTRLPDTTLNKIADYYTDKVDEHGPTARGVDWNSPDSQMIRFEQLSKVVQETGEFSVSDWGCGYGAMYEYLVAHWPEVNYVGWDISAAMIEAGLDRWKGNDRVRFELGAKPLGVSDYAFASGVFNVRLDATDAEWLKFIYEGMDMLNDTSKKAFGFNCLTAYSDEDRMQGYLYYADPRYLFDRCVTRYSRNVSLLHGYGLYEFTILVRKEQ